jgi:hypothetical protein
MVKFIYRCSIILVVLTLASCVSKKKQECKGHNKPQASEQNIDSIVEPTATIEIQEDSLNTMGVTSNNHVIKGCDIGWVVFEIAEAGDEGKLMGVVKTDSAGVSAGYWFVKSHFKIDSATYIGKKVQIEYGDTLLDEESVATLLRSIKIIK